MSRQLERRNVFIDGDECRFRGLCTSKNDKYGTLVAADRSEFEKFLKWPLLICAPSALSVTGDGSLHGQHCTTRPTAESHLLLEPRSLPCTITERRLETSIRGCLVVDVLFSRAYKPFKSKA